jgi:hypothetical protein
MSRQRLYLRTFGVGAVWFSAVAFKMVSRHPGPWSTYPARNLLVLIVAWVVTGLLLGVAATHFERLRSWFAIGLGTVAGSFAVLGIMLLLVQPRPYTQATAPEFKKH